LSWNVLVQWEDGSQTYEPLIEMAKDDPVTLAMYASENDLLAVPGWRRFNRLLRNRDDFNRTVSLTKQRKGDPIFKFGVLVPRNSREALKFDADAGNTRWADAMALELAQHCEYKTYKDLGKGAAKPGPGYQHRTVDQWRGADVKRAQEKCGLGRRQGKNLAGPGWQRGWSGGQRHLGHRRQGWSWLGVGECEGSRL
jgi:hypothetical protein